LFVVSELPETDIATEAQQPADSACLVTVVDASNVVVRLPSKITIVIKQTNDRQFAQGALTVLLREQAQILLGRNPVRSFQPALRLTVPVCHRVCRAKPLSFRTILLRVGFHPRPIRFARMLSAQIL